MPTTYSTSLKLSLMGNGENSGTWGTITNTNLDIVEQAIAGTASIVMSNADYTLSNPNGTTGEAHAMVLYVTGANSASRKVVAPLVPKVYIVSNNTSGGNDITVGAVSGLVATVPNGTSTLVYCDGTNFYAGLTGTAGNFNIGGAATVGSTLSVSGAVTGNSFSGAGTGLTGTASGLSIGGNAATATSATTSTTAGTANALNAANSYSVARILVGNGSAAAPSLAFSSDGAQDTGFYWDTDGRINIANNGVYSGQFYPAGSLTLGGTVTAGTFAGAGTSLTGTASGLSIGGNAATATDSVNLTQDSGTHKLVCQNDGNTVFYENGLPGWNITTTALFLPSIGGNVGGAPLSWNLSDGGIRINASSERFKTNITNAWYGLSDVMKLRPVTYNDKKDPNGQQYGGLIAEEVADAGLEEFVVRDKNNNPLTLQYSNMVSLAFKAIQELNAKVTALENELATLKG